MRPIGILYEHPEWFVPLFAELERRGVPHRPLHVDDLVYDPDQEEVPFSLVVNRMSPSAWRRGRGEAIFQVRDYLAHLEGLGVPVVNGPAAYQVEISKARQLSLFARLGVPHPRARVIHRPEQAPSAARRLRFPVLVKPNIGGSGAGIVSFDNPEDLVEAVPVLELGPDHTALVQEHLPARGGEIVRVEILGDRFLYAIRLRLEPGGFNLCPADYCRPDADGVSGRGLPVERYQPPDQVVEDVRRIVAAAGMDLGGVEYLVDDRDGRPTFYDVNALSNFVADAPAVLGFDPFVDLVDFLLERAERAVPVV